MSFLKSHFTFILPLKHAIFTLNFTHLRPPFLWLYEFSSSLIQDLRTVGISSVSGQGCGAFFKQVESAVGEYYEDYVPYLEELRQAIARRKEEEMQEQLKKLKVWIISSFMLVWKFENMSIIVALGLQLNFCLLHRHRHPTQNQTFYLRLTEGMKCC